MLHEPELCAAVEKAAAREGQAEGAPHREGWHREPSPCGVLRCVLLEGVECGDAAPLRLMHTWHQSNACVLRALGASTHCMGRACDCLHGAS